MQNAGADPGFDRGGGPDRDRPKTAILGPQFCRILVLGPHFWWSGGARAPGAPLDPPLKCLMNAKLYQMLFIIHDRKIYLLKGSATAFE